MAEDIILEHPQATSTISLGRDATISQGLTREDPISALPQKNTLYLPEIDQLNEAFTISGYVPPDTYQQFRKDLWLAAKDWATAGDGQSRLTWGQDVGAVDWDFNVAIVTLVFTWTAKEPGTPAKKYLTFELVLQEVGDIGSLNL